MIFFFLLMAEVPGILPSTVFLPESPHACLFQLWFFSSSLHLVSLVLALLYL